MRILIVGAGKVGSSVAATFVSESNDITIVDKDADRIADIQGTHDLQGIVGDGSSPSILAEAGAADADMLVAVTASDEVNLAVSLLAAHLFNIPARIARVRNNELRQFPELLSKGGFCTTSVIWPEQAITNYIVQLIQYPEALQVSEFAGGKAVLISLKVVANAPMAGQPLEHIRDLLPGKRIRIVSIYRTKYVEERLTSKTVINAGDEVYFFVEQENSKEAIKLFRPKIRRSDRIMIAGGDSLGLQLAQALDNAETETGGSYNVKIISPDEEQCLYLAQNLSSSVLVLKGDMSDETLFINEGIANTDLFIAISGDDENNILGCLLAKKLGAHRAIALINRANYLDLAEGTAIDIALSPTRATLSDLLRHVRHGDVVSAHVLRRDGAEILEIIAHGTPKNSKVVGKNIGSIHLPPAVAFCGVIRVMDGEPFVYIAHKDFVIKDGDQLIVFVGNKKQIPAVEKLFAPSVSFF